MDDTKRQRGPDGFTEEERQAVNAAFEIFSIGWASRATCASERGASGKGRCLIYGPAADPAR